MTVPKTMRPPRAASFADLTRPLTISTIVETPYGDSIRYELGVLTFHEWNEIVLSVQEPPIPRSKRGEGGEMVPNPDDVTYKAAFVKVDEERRLRLLARSLELGGLGIPGASLLEKADALRDANVAHLTALWTFLKKVCQGGRADIEHRAETFHPLRGGAVGSDGSVQDNANRVDEPVGSVENGPDGLYPAAAQAD